MPSNSPDITAGLDRIRKLLETDTSLREDVNAAEDKWKGSIFHAQRHDVTQPDGTMGVRDIVWHHGGAGVLAVRGGRMCLVRQWRVALGRVTLEIPAGKLDEGEDGATAAARELSEETGLIADRLTLIAKAAGSPGFTNEATRIYRAHGLRESPAHPEQDEFVDVVWVEPETVIAAAAAGLIQDAKTIIAAYAAVSDADETRS